MANFRLTSITQKNQWQRLIAFILSVVIILTAVIGLLLSGKPSLKKNKETTKLTGIVDESFSEANTESAISMQQAELEFLKKQMGELKENIEKNNKAHEQELNEFASKAIEKRILEQSEANEVKSIVTHPIVPTRIYSASFHYGKRHTAKSDNHLNLAHYVPSGTFVRAVVLGGADADASVNGQSKNNGVMLFKLLQPGTLPNGQRSHLQGCFVTASSYGDISSERAYVILDKLSCAQPAQPIIDKNVTGWAFFGGKVGIKGLPLMRDNKVMQWAGISGAMSGVAAAAQYSQSIQNITPLGASTMVPSGSIAPYAGYGGVSKAAEVLSNYYVKRAEQYHPVIQVGSGNLVTIVFKDGFYLEPDEAVIAKGQHKNQIDGEGDPNFEVPREVLSKIDKTYDDKRESEVQQ